jgi:hypothetical protein
MVVKWGPWVGCDVLQALQPAWCPKSWDQENISTILNNSPFYYVPVLMFNVYNLYTQAATTVCRGYGSAPSNGPNRVGFYFNLIMAAETVSETLCFCNHKKFWKELIAYFPWYDTGHIENDSSNNVGNVSTEPLASNDSGIFTEPSRYL